MFKQQHFYRNIAGLIGLIVGFRLIAFFALLRKTYRKSWSTIRLFYFFFFLEKRSDYD